MWASMDSGELFGVSNEWMKSLEYVIESGGEYYTRQERFALIACLFVTIGRFQLRFSHPIYHVIVKSEVLNQF
jgi:hypothetical protein